jgi:tripartite-type tricarboxylate transporter receptor subunit TctC
VAQKIHAAVLKTLADPAVVKQLEGTGGVASPTAQPADLKRFVQSQVAKWKKVVAEANIPQQ